MYTLYMQSLTLLWNEMSHSNINSLQKERRTSNSLGAHSSPIVSIFSHLSCSVSSSLWSYCKEGLCIAQSLRRYVNEAQEAATFSYNGCNHQGLISVYIPPNVSTASPNHCTLETRKTRAGFRSLLDQSLCIHLYIYVQKLPLHHTAEYMSVSLSVSCFFASSSVHTKRHN